ncbi:hypothetical protein M2139_000813 [Enterococcus sp. PF1-24]|uniref:DUF4303 domain-containing protein n=1 Tax=unclassified Enterococcus TaxID=2608891 RepID=UPI002474AC82|nr:MULTISPECIES: DUF4303 domain-containing protein [unclassified Enterococcus]MDH6363884.1 hypothetical protein [Enterococcus sp. PFB1-1]MDH6400930.1 hypothetical protein [Enterococcus sp. PF1-24]
MEIDTKKIVEFATNGVTIFLNDNPTLEFYAFAFDCNAEDAEINLCFNTEEAFSETLSHYQTGNNADYYKNEENIQRLKFNTGDWKFQCFDTLYVFDDEELTTIFNNLYPNGVQDDYQAWKSFIKNSLESFTQTLIQFSKTDVFKLPTLNSIVLTMMRMLKML